MASARSEVPQERLGVVQKIPCQRYVLDLIVGDSLYWCRIESVDDCTGVAHQDRGMGRYDELRRFLFYHRLEHGNERQESERREGRLGFIEQIQTARDKTLAEQLQKALTVDGRCSDI